MQHARINSSKRSRMELGSSGVLDYQRCDQAFSVPVHVVALWRPLSALVSGQLLEPRLGSLCSWGTNRVEHLQEF